MGLLLQRAPERRQQSLADIVQRSFQLQQQELAQREQIRAQSQNQLQNQLRFQADQARAAGAQVAAQGKSLIEAGRAGEQDLQAERKEERLLEDLKWRMRMTGDRDGLQRLKFLEQLRKARATGTEAEANAAATNLFLGQQFGPDVQVPTPPAPGGIGIDDIESQAARLFNNSQRPAGTDDVSDFLPPGDTPETALPQGSGAPDPLNTLLPPPSALAPGRLDEPPPIGTRRRRLEGEARRRAEAGAGEDVPLPPSVVTEQGQAPVAQVAESNALSADEKELAQVQARVDTAEDVLSGSGNDTARKLAADRMREDRDRLNILKLRVEKQRELAQRQQAVTDKAADAEAKRQQKILDAKAAKESAAIVSRSDVVQATAMLDTMATNMQVFEVRDSSERDDLTAALVTLANAKRQGKWTGPTSFKEVKKILEDGKESFSDMVATKFREDGDATPVTAAPLTKAEKAGKLLEEAKNVRSSFKPTLPR